MCGEIINESKIDNVIYSAKNQNNNKKNNYKQIDNTDIINKCETLIKNKFIELRNK